MTIAVALALLQAVSPTLAQIDGLSPQDAGRLVVPQASAPIVAIETPSINGLPLERSEYELIEAPQRASGGCVRGRWRAKFVGTGAEKDRVLDGLYQGQEVALASSSGACPDTSYTRLNGGLDPAAAITVLKQVDVISTGKWRGKITCSSTYDPALCASEAATLAGLRAVKPWAVMQSDGEAKIWLGTPGEVVTEVRFRPDRMDEVAVARSVPPPF